MKAIVANLKYEMDLLRAEIGALDKRLEIAEKLIVLQNLRLAGLKGEMGKMEKSYRKDGR